MDHLVGERLDVDFGEVGVVEVFAVEAFVDPLEQAFGFGGFPLLGLDRLLGDHPGHGAAQAAGQAAVFELGPGLFGPGFGARQPALADAGVQRHGQAHVAGDAVEGRRRVGGFAGRGGRAGVGDDGLGQLHRQIAQRLQGVELPAGLVRRRGGG